MAIGKSAIICGAVVMSVIWLTAVSCQRSHMCYRLHQWSGAQYTDAASNHTVKTFAVWGGHGQIKEEHDYWRRRGDVSDSPDLRARVRCISYGIARASWPAQRGLHRVVIAPCRCACMSLFRRVSSPAVLGGTQALQCTLADLT